MNLRISAPFSLLFSTFIFVFSFSGLAQAPDSEQYKAGEKVYTAHCKSCHRTDDKVSTGPWMKGAEQRWIDGADHDGIKGREWLNRWVRNSQEVVKSGNPYAVQLFEKNNKSIMTAFTQLTDQDIANVLAFVDNYVSPIPPPPPPPPGGEEASPYTSLFLYALVALLLFIVLILGRLTATLNRLALEKQGLPVSEQMPFYRDKKFTVTIGMVLLIYVGYATVNGAMNLGRQQGYQPTQPIKFSHELHAGINKINCQYCHSSAAQSKHANIPSVNVCMNCHKGVNGDTPKNAKFGRKEITKIYAAAGYDPNTLSYIKDYQKMDPDSAKKLYTEWLKGDEKKHTKADIEEVLAFVKQPVEWVRIHNLPDHVYFNHSQHVTAGGIECQTCHGPIQEMPEVYQFAPLSMGWCVNCHRTTEVNFAKNDFYKSYHQLHEDLKNQKIDKVTVETIGGTECQKCHY